MAKPLVRDTASQLVAELAAGQLDLPADPTTNLGASTKQYVDAAQRVLVNDQTSTAYTLALTDAGKDVRCTNAGPIAVTVPPNSSVPFPLGVLTAISQGGAGTVTVVAGAGVTLQAANGVATTTLYDARVIEQLTANTWRVW